MVGKKGETSCPLLNSPSFCSAKTRMNLLMLRLKKCVCVNVPGKTAAWTSIMGVGTTRCELCVIRVRLTGAIPYPHPKHTHTHTALGFAAVSVLTQIVSRPPSLSLSLPEHCKKSDLSSSFFFD